MQPIKILHIVSTLKVGSGVMSIIMNLYRHIDRKKVQFDFLYFIEDDISYKAEIEALGGKTYFIPKPTIKTLIPYIKAYKEFLYQHAGEYKALHLHEVYLSSLYMPLAHKYGIKHCIIHAHSTRYSDKTIKAIRNYFLCLPIKKNADIFFACSEAAGRFLYGNKYVEEGKVRILYNAVDSEKFVHNSRVRREIREELNVKDKFVVGHIGRFSKEKNHAFLLKIFCEIKKVKADSLLILIGEGPLLVDVKRQIDQLGLTEDVKLLGVRQDVYKILQGFDVFILPSLFEGLSVSAIESQAAGLPTYASDNLTKETKVVEEMHFLSLKQNPKEWADKIVKESKGFKRRVTTQIIRQKGFDVIQEAYKLETYYLELK